MAVRDLATRRVAADVPTMPLATLGFSTTIPAGVFLLLLGETWQVPTANFTALLIIAVAFGVVGYFAITVAMRVGEVSAVTPFRYARLIFGTSLGVLFLHETFDRYIVIGSLILILTGIYSIWREAKLRQSPVDSRVRAG